MDPNMTMSIMLNHPDHTARINAAYDMLDWLDADGFAPTFWGRYETRKLAMRLIHGENPQLRA